jgi:hypothetical protein
VGPRIAACRSHGLTASSRKGTPDDDVSAPSGPIHPARLLRRLDDDHVDRAALGLERQPELVLQRS